MACIGKTNLTCTGAKQYSKCIYYEGILGDTSELEDCVTLEETTEELYGMVDEINEKINLSDLSEDCIEYPTERTLLNVLQAQQGFICAQNTLITEMQSQIATMQSQIIDLTNNCN